MFCLDITFDNDLIHPKAICRAHELTILKYKTMKKQATLTEFKTSIVPINFTHHHNSCRICDTPKVGRKRKQLGTKHTSLKTIAFPSTADTIEKERIQETNSETTDYDMVNVTENGSKHENLKASDLLLMFQNLTPTEKNNFIGQLPKVLTEDESGILAYNIAKQEQSNILLDAQNISSQYLDKDLLLNLDPKTWISKRNYVTCKFIEGVTGFDPITNKDSKDTARNKILSFCQVLEQIYHIRMQKLVAPLSFMFALEIYSKTSSKTVIDIACKTLPSGSYTTITNWLSKSGDDPPPCPQGNVMVGFDNEQVIAYKRGVTPHQKSRSSVITTTVFVQMNEPDQTSIQMNETLKPRNLFSVKHFEEKILGSTIPDNIKEFRKQKADFEKEIIAIRDQTLEDYLQLERIHYEQLFFFVQNAIETVMKQQEVTDLGMRDMIDQTILAKERKLDIIVCGLCGAENARRKLVCDSCKQREGIRQSRKNKDPSTSVQQKRNNKGKEIEIDPIGGHHIPEQTNRYEHIPTEHQNRSDIIMGMPAFLNPNSNESVSLILRHLGKSAGITRYGGTDRKWCFICCDGRPHSLIQKLLDEAVVCNYCNSSFLNRSLYSSHHKDQHRDRKPMCTREFDWMYLRIGAGHFEMNVVKAFFELNWVPFLEKMGEVMGFNSENAKSFAKTCKDHHVAWQLLLAFHTASLQEIVLPYVRYTLQNQLKPTADNFFLYYKREQSHIPNLSYIQMQVFRFSQAIINLRMGIRRNNPSLVRSAKYHLKELFYGRSHPHYQNIELFDAIQYQFMPDEVRKVWDSKTSFTVTGDMSKGQDLDFLLEEKNKSVKQYLPSGSIPSDETWKTICCNLKYFENLNDKLFSLLGIANRKEYGTKSLDIADAIDEFRPVLRQYFKASHPKRLTSVSGQELHGGLLEFLEKSSAKRVKYINKTVLHISLDHDEVITEPVFITKEEENNHKFKLSKADLAVKIKQMIDLLSDDSILHSHYLEVLKSIDNPQVKKGNYLTLYYELNDIVAGARTRQYNIETDDETGIN